jgi:hypothetical protein
VILPENWAHLGDGFCPPATPLNGTAALDLTCAITLMINMINMIREAGNA